MSGFSWSNYLKPFGVLMVFAICAPVAHGQSGSRNATPVRSYTPQPVQQSPQYIAPQYNAPQAGSATRNAIPMPAQSGSSTRNAIPNSPQNGSATRNSIPMSEQIIYPESSGQVTYPQASYNSGYYGSGVQSFCSPTTYPTYSTRRYYGGFRGFRSFFRSGRNRSSCGGY